MGILESIARLHYESKKFKLKKEEPIAKVEEPKRVYKIDIYKIIQGHQNCKIEEASKEIRQYSLEYIRLRDLGFGYDDIKRILGLTDKTMQIIINDTPLN